MALWAAVPLLLALAPAYCAAEEGSLLVALRVRTSHATGAGTTSGASFAFQVGGVWQADSELCTEASAGALVEAVQTLHHWPGRVRLRVSRNATQRADAWGLEEISVAHVATGRALRALEPCTGALCEFRAGSAHWVYSEQFYNAYEVPELDGAECCAIPALSEWMLGPWGECNASCGEGVRHRSVACVPGGACNGSTAPAERVLCLDTSGCAVVTAPRVDASGSEPGECLLQVLSTCVLRWWGCIALAVLLALCMLSCLVCGRLSKRQPPKKPKDVEGGGQVTPNFDGVVWPQAEGVVWPQAEVVVPEPQVPQPLRPQQRNLFGNKWDSSSESLATPTTEASSDITPELSQSDDTPEECGLQILVERGDQRLSNFLGTWSYGTEGGRYTLSAADAGHAPRLLRFHEHLRSGEQLSGVLRPEYDGFVGKLFRNCNSGKPSGETVGIMRVSLVEGHKLLRASFKPSGKLTWGAEELAQRVALPGRLHVKSWSVQRSCAGIYELVIGEYPGGLPLWRKLGARRWLYSGTDSHWYVGGILAEARKFSSTMGYVTSLKPHKGALPNELEPGAWAFCERGGTWCVEPTISVETAATAEAQAWWCKGGDEPGPYIVLHDHTAVTSELAMSQTTVFTHLAIGTVVNVIEVVHLTKEARLRGCIEEPYGWISLVDTDNGYRWAGSADEEEDEETSLAVGGRRQFGV